MLSQVVLAVSELGVYVFLSVSERPGGTSQRASNQQSGAERDDGILLQETGRSESKLLRNIITVLSKPSHISRICKVKIVQMLCCFYTHVLYMYLMFAHCQVIFIPVVLYCHIKSACFMLITC